MERLSDDGENTSAEDMLLTFVVRIWVEETAAEAGSLTWRGTVVHLPSRERRYVEDVQAIAEFIREHLARIG